MGGPHMMKIENVRLVPNISIGGHLESEDDQNNDIYWVNESGSRENLNISTCGSILIDKMSSTALLSSDGRTDIKMLHFLNGDVEKLVEYIVVNRRGDGFEGFNETITGP